MNTYTNPGERRLRRRSLALAALSAAGLLAVLTACADTGDAPAGDEAASSTQAIRAEVSELLPEDLEGALRDALPDELQGDAPLRFATDATYGVPIASVTESGGAIEGFTVDVAQAIGYVLGKDVEFVNTPFDNLIPGLQANRFDGSITIMLDTQERQKSVDFVDYLIDGSSVLVAGDSELNDLTLDDMCGLSAGAVRGSVEAGYLEQKNASCSDPIRIQIYQGNNDMLLALTSGRLDVLMGPASQISYIESTMDGEVRSGGDLIGVAVDGIAFEKGNELAPAVRDSLQQLIDSGAYAQILALWGMESSAVDEAVINGGQL